MDAPLIGNQFYAGPIEEVSGAKPFGGVAGFLDTYYSRTSSDDTDVNANSWSLRGSLNAAIGAGVNMQVDGAISWIDQDGGEATQYSGTGHLYYRPQIDYAVGGFAHLSRNDTTIYGLGGSGDAQTKDYLFGAEAGWFTDQAASRCRAAWARRISTAPKPTIFWSAWA
mgnify:FL=1